MEEGIKVFCAVHVVRVSPGNVAKNYDVSNFYLDMFIRVATRQPCDCSSERPQVVEFLFVVHLRAVKSGHPRWLTTCDTVLALRAAAPVAT